MTAIVLDDAALDALVRGLRAVDQGSVEDCFLQSPLLVKAADAITALRAKVAEMDAPHISVVARLTYERDEARAEVAKLEAQMANLTQAARDVLDETDRILVIDPPPIKYRAPYGTLARLRVLLGDQP